MAHSFIIELDQKSGAHAYELQGQTWRIINGKLHNFPVDY